MQHNPRLSRGARASFIKIIRCSDAEVNWCKLNFNVIDSYGNKFLINLKFKKISFVFSDYDYLLLKSITAKLRILNKCDIQPLNSCGE